MRHLLAFLILIGLFVALIVITRPDPATDAALAINRTATGGATTLEDILRRQNGQEVDNAYRQRDVAGNAENVLGMGPLGGSSDADLWRAMRFDKMEDPTVTTYDKVGRVLIQDNGMWWLDFRAGPLRTYGGLLLLGVIGVLAVFYFWRGRVRIQGGKTGHTVTRFEWIERFAHWLLAGSFLLLAVTGLLTLFGRAFIAPLLGKEINATLLEVSKLIHNNISWAFMLGLLMVFVMWVWHNIPDKTDIQWFKEAGGLVGDSHPPAKKFNGGQKIIFWSVILLGGSISLSGLSLLFPFDMPLMGKTFSFLHDIGAARWFGLDAFPAELTPQEEMQYTQLWHAIVGFGMMAVIIGHIYIGTIGMEGAFDAMGSGEVDENWAYQHHSIWYEKLERQGETDTDQATPAE